MLRRLIPVSWMISTLWLNVSVHAETLASKKMELSQVSGQIHSLEKIVQNNTTTRAGLQEQLKTAELAMGKSTADIGQLTRQLAAQQKILNDLNFTETLTRARLKMQYEALASQLRAAYKLGTQNQLKILLNQENRNTANRHLMYYKTLNAAREKLIGDIRQNLALLQTTVQASRIHQQVLKKLLAEKERQQKREQRMLQLRQSVIATLGLQTEDKQRQIALLMANQKALQETITRLQQKEITINGQSFDQLQNKLAWPLKGSFATDFGSLIESSNQHSTGIMIRAPMGTPVHAIYSGRVVFADWLRGSGLLVIINHGHQYMSLYARNQTLRVKAGQQVQTGDVIATAGNSGGYPDTGLYLEVRQNGIPVNPRRWCR